MKKLVYILSLIFLWGCSGPLQSSWNNFRAYYNTHYNAKKSFRAGLKQVEKQPVVINPGKPIRVHREPGDAGNVYFTETIDKEAQLLRKFPDSKWAEDALFLIGKAYYYRKEFYLALQKFEELHTLDPDPQLRQKAVIWKGRVLLDLGQHQDAILYLENNLNVPDDTWNVSLRARAQVLLAEHCAMEGKWESAADYLNHALYFINDKTFLGRAFFLYGQTLEYLGRYSQAFTAYDQVSSHFPDYEYIYQANIKKGQLARKEGNLDLSLSVFTSMKNDDKNHERRNELNFEIARTQEVKGHVATAEQMYNRLLYSGPDVRPVSRDLRAKVYFRLGEIYSKRYQNYTVAAAYYDSSSTQVTNTSLISENEDAGVLAEVYGRYALLRDEADKIDSLLWLGTLSASELDSVIKKAGEKKRYELRQQDDGEERATERLLANFEYVDYAPESENASQYGFLNYRNRDLAADARNRFQAIWGNRPLVDNWRSMEAVTRAGFFKKNDRAIGPPSEQDLADHADRYSPQPDINISAIPATEEQRLELIRRRTEVRYELGSLFFLTLNVPDSASSYFLQVVRDQPAGELEAKSMYSLFELYHLEGQEDNSVMWGIRILENYPNTKYAERVSRRLNKDSAIRTKP